MKNKTLNLKKGDTPVRASEALVIEPAKSWQRLQQAKDLFEDIELQAQEQHQQFLNKLMEYERREYLRYEGDVLAVVEPEFKRLRPIH